MGTIINRRLELGISFGWLGWVCYIISHSICNGLIKIKLEIKIDF